MVGWLIADRENTTLAKRLIEQSCETQQIKAQQLTLHSDRGSPMTSRSTAQLLARLSVTRSLSRPQTSNDNPFSEAHFKTLKYHPGFPSQFGAIEDAQSFCRRFFTWYNTDHRHAGLAMLTPEDVHYGRAEHVLARRQDVLEAAFRDHPERFVPGKPMAPTAPEAAWINPPPQPRVEEDDSLI